jgi:hypothetical protein
MTTLKSASICLTMLLVTGQAAMAEHPMFARTTAASNYFRGRETIIPGQRARRPAPKQVEVTRTGKPFENIYREPTLSPYLSLDLVNDQGTGLPNYYAFVQPQRQQQQANQSQEARIRRLQQQLRTSTAKGAVTRNIRSGMPTTGSSSHFMNLGNYYPDLAR